jgi:hypothetical protein
MWRGLALWQDKNEACILASLVEKDLSMMF